MFQLKLYSICINIYKKNFLISAKLPWKQSVNKHLNFKPWPNLKHRKMISNMSNLNLSLISIISNVQMSIEYKVSKTVLITPFYASALQLVLEHITHTIYLVIYIHFVHHLLI